MSYRPLPPMMPIVGFMPPLQPLQPPLSLLQLDEHAPGAGRMDECYQRMLGAWPRLLVDQANAARLQLRQHCTDVVDAQRDVMQPRTAFVDVFRDRRLGRRRLEQL